METQNSDLIFYHNPHSRASSVLALLMELEVPYKRVTIDFRTEDEYKPEFTKINPMSKIPTIVHKGVVVTEQPAVYQYLADEFAYGRLSPKIGSPERGSFLRWLSFYGSSFEPALIDLTLKREVARPSSSPYGTAELVLKTLNNHLASSTFMSGEMFTAADVLWGAGLSWVTHFKLIEKTSEIEKYLGRVLSRPSFAKAQAMNDAIAKEMGLV